MSSRTWLKAVSFVILALVTLVSSGCIKINVVDRTLSSLDLSLDVAGQDADGHNMAVLAVDFDPPLEYDEILARRDRGEGITLLVAVENTGTSTEQGVTVEIALSKDSDTTAFLEQEGTIDLIAPGEIKIVQFRDADIPFSLEYLLQVRVVPVPGETRLADNQKNYDLLITQP